MESTRNRAKQLLQTALDIVSNVAVNDANLINACSSPSNAVTAGRGYQAEEGRGIRPVRRFVEPNAREDSSVQSWSPSLEAPARGGASNPLGRRQMQAAGNDDNAASKEQKKLFGFYSKTGNKRKRSCAGPRNSMTLEKIKYWSHDCICLSRRNHDWVPSPQEKMDLALLGLGLKRLSFNINAGPQEISAVVYDSFPQLSGCGYEMLRTGTTRRKLVVIRTPPEGMTVPYLRDLVQQSKLFLRPTSEDIQGLVSSAGDSDDELCISSDSETNVNITIGADNSPQQGSTKQSEPCIQSNHTEPVTSFAINTPAKPTPAVDEPQSHSAHFRAFIADESDEEFEKAIQEAIQNSLAAAETDNATANFQPELQSPRIMFEDAFRAFTKKVLKSDVQRLVVRRSNIWEDSFKAIYERIVL
eukprot:Em0344g1a